MASVADNIMVGQLGSVPLAAISFATNIYVLIFLIGVGIAIGLTPAVGKANGEGDTEAAGKYLINGIGVNLLSGFVLTAVLFSCNFFLDEFGQSPDVVESSRGYFLILSLSIIPYMFFLAFKQFLEGITLTRPGMIAILVGNILNVFFNWLLIFGNWGFPKMGIEGAGWATFISRIIMVIIILVIIAGPRFRVYLKGRKPFNYSKEKFKKIFKLGIPTGLQFAFEVSAFSMAGIMIGWIGSSELAAHQIAINLAAITFMMAGGLGSAATISLSNFLGRKEFYEMKRSGYASIFMAALFMGITAVLFLLTRQILPSFYTDDQIVITLAADLLIVAAIFQLSDGLQVTLLGALRGLHDVKVPTIITVIAYWGFTIPVSYILGFEFELGQKGVWYGLLLGLSIAALFLYFRFEYLSKKIIEGKIEQA